MPARPKCFRWSMVIWSGPSAVEFWLFLIASTTAAGEDGKKLGSSLCSWCSCVMMFLCLGSLLCVVITVKCLLNC